MTIVTLEAGALRGAREGTLTVFRGIPYAAPPVGALRWRPPRPVQPWDGVRDALAFGPDVPQPPDADLRAPRQDEDGLYLNVWTTAAEAGARLPVLVWLPGGGFLGGSGSNRHTDGAALATHGAVVVAINYRCGLFGFLAHPALSRESEHGVSGNYGLLDQLAALEWVRENIAAFGGDPGCVTLFGMSAGAASTSLLLTAPRASGLFQRAILQSPGAGRTLATLAQAERAGQALGADLDALRALPWPELLARTSLLTPKVRSLTMPRVLRPICDGWLLPRQERDALRQGHLQAMPLIVGTNADEGSLLTRAWAVDGVAAWREQVDANFGALADEASALYPVREDGEARMRVAQMFADTQFNYGARLLARGMARLEPRTFKYLFLRRRPQAVDGPHHGDETAHAFGNVEAGEQELARTMGRYWVRFAATGDPNGPGLPCWDSYRAADDNHQVLDVPVSAGGRWREPQLDFIERFYQ